MTTGSSTKFGRHLRSLRKARDLSQEVLGNRSNLSTDTIRRLESGKFSPSLETLRKVCAGLEIELSTLFSSFELAIVEDRELVDLVSSRKPNRVEAVTKIVRVLFDQVDELVAAELRDDDGDDDGDGDGDGD